MYISTLFNAVLIFQSLLFPIELFFSGKTIYFNILTLILVELIILFLLFINNSSLEKEKPLIFTLLVAMEMWVLLRLHVILPLPDELHFNYLIKFQQSDINFSLFMILLSLIFLYLGIRTGSKILGKSISPKKSSISYFKKIEINKLLSFLSFYNLFILSSNIIINHYFISKTLYTTPKAISLISKFLGYDIPILLFISIFILAFPNSTKIQKRFGYFIFLFFIVIRTLDGSKGSVLHILFFTLWGFFGVYNKHHIKKKYLLLGILFFPISIILFAAGHTFRIIKRASLSFDDILNLFNNIDTSSYFFKFWDMTTLLSGISRRISMTEYLILLFTQKSNEAYLKFSYTFKNLINSFLLGSPFEYATKTPSNLFRLNFGQNYYSDIYYNYHSDMLPLFGQLFYWGGLPFLIIGLVCTGLIFSLLFQYFKEFSSPYRIFASTILLFSFFNFLFGMGIRNWLVDLVFVIFFQLIFLCIISSIFLFNPLPHIYKTFKKN